ncbi:MAG: GNAT family N-acetyltransferase [Chloroflexi bacterium]|nr:GNAT family N-acetyltransferase [Chloroflexota bacterium]
MICRDDVVARGRRAVLRRKRMSDVVEDYAWRSDENLARFDAAPPVRVPFADYVRNWSFDLRFTDVTERAFAIEDESGRRIGNLMYYNADRSRRQAELGISIGEPDYWSRGYGSDAVTVAVRYIFQHTSVRRLYLHTLDWNQRAQRAFEKAGFAVCGTFWRNGQTFLVMEVRRERQATRPREARTAWGGGRAR